MPDPNGRITRSAERHKGVDSRGSSCRQVGCNADTETINEVASADVSGPEIVHLTVSTFTFRVADYALIEKLPVKF